jgi:hypothetical protein
MMYGQDAFSYLGLKRDHSLKHRDCMFVKVALVNVIECIEHQKASLPHIKSS